MILSALYQYYNEVSKTGHLAPIGMSYEKISFIIVITQEGDFVRLEDLRGGDSPEGRSILVVQPIVRTSGVKPNLFWDKPIYALGWEGGEECPHCKAFVEKVSELCAKYPEEKDLEAVRRFYAQEKAFRECFESFSETVSKAKLASAKSNYIGFRIDTEPNPSRLVCSNNLLANEMLEAEQEALCLVTGERLPMATLHPQVSIGGSKLSLVNYNDPAFNSYGKKNGENAPVSQQAAKAYALGLGHLLEKGKKTNSRIGEIIFAFWNEHPNEELISRYHQAIFDSNSSKNANEEEEEGEDLDKAPKRRSSKKKKDVTPDQEAYKVYDALNSIYLGNKSNIDVDAQEAFYILGLLPGQGRAAVKLWKKGTVREIVGNTLPPHCLLRKAWAVSCSMRMASPRARAASIFALSSSIACLF